MNEVAVESLRKVLKKKVTDKFKVGDVVRWKAAGRFEYAAIKTEAGWFTTASNTNRFVSSFVNYEELVEILGRSEVSNILVSTGWAEVEV